MKAVASPRSSVIRMYLRKSSSVKSLLRTGTIQEIFQDAAQNFYRSFEHFSPMVLLGVRHWTETYPIVPVLSRLFTDEDFRRYILITDDLGEATAFIEAFKP